MTLGDEAFKAIGVSEAPSGKLSKYIIQHARGYGDWFVTIEGATNGLSLSKEDVDLVKTCRVAKTLHVHGNEIHSDEVNLVIYAI
jgi:hypothetical protein